jgi:hypothetical protein
MARDGSSLAQGFLVHVNVLSRLFSARFLTMLIKAHAQGRLNFFGDHAALTDSARSGDSLRPCARSNGSHTF